MAPYDQGLLLGLEVASKAKEKLQQQQQQHSSKSTAGHSGELVGHIIAFNKHRKQIDAVYSSLGGGGRVEEVQTVDLIELAKDCFDPSMRQMSLTGGGDHFVSGIDNLYEAAVAAMVVFSLILKVDVASSLISIFPDIGSHIHIAPLKNQKRAEEKAKDDYGERKDGPGVAWLYDIVRGMVECDSQEEVCAVIAALHTLSLSSSSPRVQVVRLKNRFKSPTPSGFRDVNLNLRVEIGGAGSGVFHVCELQVHLKAIYEFDKAHKSHYHYEYFRKYFRGSNEAIKARLELFRQFEMQWSDTNNKENKDGAIFMKLIVDQALNHSDSNYLFGLFDLLNVIDEIELCEKVTRCLLVVLCIKDDLVELYCAFSNFGNLLTRLAKYDEAAEMYKRSIIGLKSTGGGVHLLNYTAISYGNLLKRQKRYSESLEFISMGLTGLEKCVGPFHTDTLIARGAMGDLLRQNGKFDEAFDLMNFLLIDEVRLLGKDHPQTLQSLFCLGMLTSNRGDDEEASKKLQYVLEGYEKLYGQNHHQTLSVMSALADILRRQGKLNESYKLIKKAVICAKSIMSSEHPESLDIIYSLGRLLESQGNRDEAKVLYLKAMSGYEKLSYKKDRILDVYASLAEVLRDQGILDEALRYMEKARVGYEIIQGPDGSKTLEITAIVALILRETGSINASITMTRNLLQKQESLLGLNHLSTLKTVNNLGLALYVQKKYDESYLMLLRALTSYESVLSHDHELTLDVVNNISTVLDYLGRLDEAYVMLVRAVNGREKVLGEFHLETLGSKYNLGDFFFWQNKMTDSLKMFKEVLIGYSQVLGDSHERTNHVRNRVFEIERKLKI